MGICLEVAEKVVYLRHSYGITRNEMAYLLDILQPWLSAYMWDDISIGNLLHIVAIIAGIVVFFCCVVAVVRRMELDEDDNAEAPDDTTIERHGVKTVNVNTKSMNMENRYEGMNTPVLVRAILGDLNCKYDETEDGLDLFFVYQGEHFALRTAGDADNPWIRIFDLSWYHSTLDKLEEISCMQKAINTANSHESCMAVYEISKDDNTFFVYSKCDLLISSSFPAPDQYLAAWLAGFFRLKHSVVMEFEKEKQRLGVS